MCQFLPKLTFYLTKLNQLKGQFRSSSELGIIFQFVLDQLLILKAS